MAGPWQTALQNKMVHGAPNSAGDPGMGQGGVPFAKGLMAKPGMPAMNPGSSGPGTGGPPPGPAQNSAPSAGMSGPPGMGGPPPPAAPPAPQTPQEIQNAMMMTQGLMQKFLQLAQRSQSSNGLNLPLQ